VALLNRWSLRALIGSAAREGQAAGISAALQALFVLGLLALAFRLIDPAFDEQEFIRRGVTAPGVLAELLAMLPFGVAAEELVFRNCQRRLRRALNPAASVLAVSLAFALYHRVPGTPLDRHEIETLLATFAGGLVLSITYERAASLSLLIVVHLSYDLLAVAQAWLNVERLRLAEAFLFLLWIGFSGLLAWGRRGAFPPRHGTLSGVTVAEAGSLYLHRSRAMPWIASLFFGAAVPFLLAWIRTRLSF
jgi:membrane protease YdiL (CAAX protease family)